MTDFMPERTIRYKTYLKNAMVAAFDDAEIFGEDVVPVDDRAVR